ncbi:hypothetical protein GCM10022277_35550 [Litoribacillus peritrichatus]|uniref:Transporter n=1 Tax=Litoribacillus peritrichatus TaxID=718191 RepID=A0ABP7N3D5_9GAMM
MPQTERLFDVLSGRLSAVIRGILMGGLVMMFASVSYSQESSNSPLQVRNDVHQDSGTRAKSGKPIVLKKKQAKDAPKRLKVKTEHEKLTLGVGAYMSHGDYTTDRSTKVFSMPFRASYSLRQWRLSAQIPYLYIDGPANILVLREGGETITQASKEDKQRWGFGDLRLNGQYSLPWVPVKNSLFHLGAGVKAPTGSEDENLSSGEFDYTVFTGGSWRDGRWVANARLGYQWMGDTDETDYNDRTFVSIGGKYLYNRTQNFGVSYRFKEAATERSQPIRSLTTYFNQQLKEGWKLSFAAGLGFSESSADYFGGLSISKSFVSKKRVKY